MSGAASSYDTPTAGGRDNAMRRGETFKTDIPARMDRLPWSRWHWLVVVALGITWILDGLEVTIVGAIGGVLTEKQTLHLSASEIGLAGAIYIAGAVLGSLFFATLADKFGRKHMFMVTLGVYLLATVLTAFSGNFLMFAIFRFFTGSGIGGEYSAINSAIDELIPARARGWTDLAINGSYWIGTLFGASATIVLLNPAIVSHNIGWRLCFGLGAVLGLCILLVRRFVPESPRWLMMHGRMTEANQVVDMIEGEIKKEDHLRVLPEPEGKPMTIRPRGAVSIIEIAKTMLQQYPQRAFLGFSLMLAQAFLYNAIFFTYSLVLTTFYKVPSGNIGLYLIPFAIGNFLGPLTIGRLFDTIGRRQMISFTYIISGVLLAISGWLFSQGLLNATTQTIAWCVIFFFASAGASSAYLTVSEVFPLETRAMAIAVFYSIGTAGGGIIGPLLFGNLIATGKPSALFIGYIIGAVLMAAGGVVEIIFGVKSERQSLESIASPLSAVADEEEGAPGLQPSVA